MDIKLSSRNIYDDYKKVYDIMLSCTTWQQAIGARGILRRFVDTYGDSYINNYSLFRFPDNVRTLIKNDIDAVMEAKYKVRD